MIDVIKYSIKNIIVSLNDNNYLIHLLKTNIQWFPNIYLIKYFRLINMYYMTNINSSLIKLKKILFILLLC
jgi:hypothetical protein